MPARLRPRTETPYQKAQDAAAILAIKAAWGGAKARPDAAAEALGISRTTLYREIKRLGIGPDLPGFRGELATVA